MTRVRGAAHDLRVFCEAHIVTSSVWAFLAGCGIVWFIDRLAT